MKMTETQAREHARRLILAQAADPSWSTIEDDPELLNTALEDQERVYDLMVAAKVTVAWQYGSPSVPQSTIMPDYELGQWDR